MRKRTIALSMITLILLACSVTFAWYHNNRQVEVLGGGDVDSIRIQSNGVLQVAYAVDGNLNPLEPGAAEFGSTLEMKLDGNSYEDITGNGMEGRMFAPILGTDGKPQDPAEFWEDAQADNAASDSDSGQYIVADLYFRSDEPMDIYMLEGSGILPISNGDDLVNTVDPITHTDYKNKTNFSDYPSGLPVLNINQSPYGLFSRNLIAGAARVSFTECEYSESGAQTFPAMPNIIWVPNSRYQLVKPATTGLLNSVKMDGARETDYSYYEKAPEGSTAAYQLRTVRRENGTGTIQGELFRKTDGGLESVIPSTLAAGKLVPGKNYTGFSATVPQIWSGAGYIDAAPVTDSSGESCLVAADYNKSTYSLSGGYAYKATENGSWINVRPKDGGYVKVERTDENSPWTETETVFTGDAASAIENTFLKDEAIGYVSTVWMDEDSFSEELDGRKCSDVRIATTSRPGSGYYYTRVRIAVWVEGCDREADLYLNGGEFNINFLFYGIKAEN